MLNRFYTLFVLLLCISLSAVAAVKLPRLISDGLVLQRQKPIPVWGWADAGEKVTITFNGKTYTAQTGSDLKWNVKLAAMEAGGPYQMVIEGSNKITVSNILVGDVWLCSGQSNMEFRMDRVKDVYAAEIASSTNDQIRQFAVAATWSFSILDDVKSKDGWKAANPTTVLNYTAAGYFFARSLYEKYKVPIGLVNSTVGGTPAESWTSAEGLAPFPDLLQDAREWSNPAKQQEMRTKDSTLTAVWFAAVKKGDEGLNNTSGKWSDAGFVPTGWNKINVPGYWDEQGLKNVKGVIWVHRNFDVPENLAGKEADLSLGHISDQDSTFINGKKVGATSTRYNGRFYHVPAGVLKAGSNSIMIRVINTEGNGGFWPAKKYRLEIAGNTIELSGQWEYHVGVNVPVLSKEGVVQVGRKPTVLYNSMIAPLLPMSMKGVIWYQGEGNAGNAEQYRTLFPAMIKDWRKKWNVGDFPFLFVQLPNLGRPPVQPVDEDWAGLREAQAMALQLPNTGMAVTYDIGEWNDLHPFNKKDVGERLSLIADNLVYGNKQVVYSGPVYTSMQVNKNKIILSFDNAGGTLKSKDNGPLKQFAIAGSDKKFVWANATIEGNKVIVWSDAVSAPVAVRYAWARNPEGANLSNQSGLLASTFRTDDWQTKKP